jgi:hypothetical protein
MPDDHSELVPPLPIPNRTVKRLHANDSADTRVKVGNRQAPHPLLESLSSYTKTPPLKRRGFCVSGFLVREVFLAAMGADSTERRNLQSQAGAKTHDLNYLPIFTKH